MLKITTRYSSETLRFIVEGRLEGAHVIELDNCWRTTATTADSPTIVDLTDVTFIDDGGKQLLSRMYERGAELIATNIMTKQVVEEVKNDTTR